MSDISNPKQMKVTDRRMFTPEGELREEFRHLDEIEEKAAPNAESIAEAVDPSAAPPPPEEPPSEPGSGEPCFVDLLSLLAENASLYLRHGSVPGGEQMQHLEMAKLHIDLLNVLKDKTRGNLTSEEREMLDDVLYRLRLAFAGQRGF